ncbi:STARD3 N-terminal-like protein isoform X1 [Betta splendens]|uniref:STARD3 N-terminal-like protein isoform X1 n=1 Tax=Betta splendens TaxID=158456 RepID=A0A6P7L024_BETSP|nr:STARD3 N-terminal-like protein isoform X1 [Betta splendens]
MNSGLRSSNPWRRISYRLKLPEHKLRSLLGNSSVDPGPIPVVVKMPAADWTKAEGTALAGRLILMLYQGNDVNGGIQKQLQQEVLHYDYHASFFDIFLLAVFRFAALILAYAVCRLRHWWAIAVTTAVCCAFLIVKVILSKLLSQGAFGYLLPIISFVLAWIETWLLDFKVLPQEAEEENRYRPLGEAVQRPPLLHPGPVSEGQFYSPPESLADSDEDLDDKQDPEKGLLPRLA